MDKNQRNILVIAIIGILLLAAMCICAAGGGYLLYNLTTNSDLDAVLEIPQVFLDSSPTEQVPPETFTPLGQEVDLNDLFAPMWESRDLLRDNYVDQPVLDVDLAQGAVEGLMEELTALGLDPETADIAEGVPSAAALGEKAGTPEEARDDFLAFWELWRAIPYIPAETQGEITYEGLMQTSLRGMVAGLGDPHTGYLDPFEVRQADLSLAGEYEGIGAWVDPTSEYLTIVAPMENSPAEEAGLLAGDRVVAIDGQDMTGLDGNVVISYILGPAGTDVTLTVERDRDGSVDVLDVTVTRAHIVVASVSGDMLDDNIAYIQLHTFGADTARELRDKLEELLAGDPRGLILDLRNNGGGFLDTAVAVTSEFLTEGVTLHERFGDGSEQTYDVRSGGVATDIPLVILVNGGTASASEIVAGAVQDYGRGLLIGVTTFGKGSVQIGQDLSNNQGALRITIARWLTPERRLIHGIGLEPDIVVELSEEDLNTDLDPQLDAAIQWMLDNTD